MEIEAGDPLILKDASKLKKMGLVKGMKGMCTGVQHIETPGPYPDEEYVGFLPDGVRKVFVIRASRVELDEERQLKLEAEKQEEEPSDA